MSSALRGGDLPRGLRPRIPPKICSGEAETGTRFPSSVTACVPNEMDFPRCLRLAWRASISVLRCSALPAEKARHETPEPFCLGLSTRLTSRRCLSGLLEALETPSTGTSSTLLLRDATASSSSSSSSLSLSWRYLVPANGDATVCCDGRLAA